MCQYICPRLWFTRLIATTYYIFANYNYNVQDLDHIILMNVTVFELKLNKTATNGYKSGLHIIILSTVS